MTEINLQPIQDIIAFTLKAEHTIVNTTIKITASISGMINPDLTEETLRENIRDMMKSFVDGTWHISGTTRSKHTSGMEQINLTATTRVSEKEYYDLDDRAKNVSEKGLAIARVDVDTMPSAELIEQAESKLRIELLAKVIAEQTLINKALDRPFRIGNISFDMETTNYSNSNARMASLNSAAASPYNMAAYYNGNGGSGEPLGNAVKLVKTAYVELRGNGY